jgi:hypothetical protein
MFMIHPPRSGVVSVKNPLFPEWQGTFLHYPSKYGIFIGHTKRNTRTRRGSSPVVEEKNLEGSGCFSWEYSPVMQVSREGVSARAIPSGAGSQQRGLQWYVIMAGNQNS